MSGKASAEAVEAVAGRLHSATIHLLRAARRDDESFGLSAARLSALSVVVFAGPLSVGSLAAAEQVRPPTITRLVQGLEQSGLVERTHDPRDGRVSLVRATGKGKRLLEAAQRRRIEAIAEVLAPLDSRDLESLEAAAEILSRQLAQRQLGGGNDSSTSAARRRR